MRCASWKNKHHVCFLHILFRGMFFPKGVTAVNRHFFVIESVTYARKGRDILVRAGYPVSIERVSRSPRGCGYVLHTVGDREKITELLKRGGIRLLEENTGGEVHDLS